MNQDKHQNNNEHAPEASFELTPAQLCRQSAIEYIGLGGKSSGKVRRKLDDLGFGYELIEACLAMRLWLVEYCAIDAADEQRAMLP